MIMNYISILKSNNKIWKWYQNYTYAPVQDPTTPNYAQLRPTDAQLHPTTSNRLQLGTQMAQGDDAVY